MSFEAGFGTAAVRYTSVDAGFRGPRGPPTVGEPATDGRGPAHGRPRTSPRTGAERATDGAGGSGYTGRHPCFSPLTCHFRRSVRCGRPRYPGSRLTLPKTGAGWHGRVS